MGIRYYGTHSSDPRYLEILSKIDVEHLESCVDFPHDIIEDFRTLALQCKNIDSDTVLVKRDSELGRFVMENSQLFSNYITYSDVVNAYNISIFEGNIKMSNKLMHPFKARMSGTTDQFLERYCKVMVDYIVEHNDFSTYLDQLDNKDSDYVYENFNVTEKKHEDLFTSDFAKVYKKK